ncbi:helix-turn-helix domain-containing protein [Nocardia arizonensis]|uniref:helix-turn-helix domain-containing protein n=1 Tax=Nocardia arizonensis TaxID=1141647 RepID=UPI0006D13045|nr:helix-turn-helix transcriptional regulator [Nocardia arizonensis]
MRTRTAGDLLRHWRLERGLSQLELASRADISARHVSFIETGRATPSRAMIGHLCDRLDIPLRERNRLLLAAGYAPAYAESALDSPAMLAVRTAVRRILVGHEPYPALAIDRGWTVVDANAGVGPLLTEVSPDLLRPPLNVLRLSLHPAGLAPRIVNLAEWRGHLLARLARQVELTGAQGLGELYEELRGYPGGEIESRLPEPEQAVVPLRLRHGDAELSFLSVTSVFGTPMNVTVAELAVESFFPADESTRAALSER